MKIYDISTPIHSGMVVYPGNPKVNIHWINKIPKSSSNVSTIFLGTHTGTHVDAPKHIDNNGKGVDSIPLKKLYGKCKVIDLTNVKFGEGIDEKQLKKHHVSRGEIILLKTKNSKVYKKFRKDFVYLTEKGAEYLVKKGARTVGIDSLSIQKFHTGYCAAHCVFLKRGIPIFEGLNLSKIMAGTYLFAGLPLNLTNSDGAPARVILIKS